MTYEAYCGWCNRHIDWDEYVINFGICNECFDESYTEYIEESAGPFEALSIPRSYDGF